MLRLLVLLALALATPAVADDDGPAFAVGLDYSAGHGGHVEELDLNLRLEAGLFVKVGRWQATISFPTHPQIRSTNTARDGDKLIGVGVAGRLMYRMPFLGGVLSFGGGMTRRWMWGDEELTRMCRVTGECIAGSYLETPSYTAWAPQLRVGIGPEKLYPRMVMAINFELIIEAIGLNDVPPDGIRAVTFMGAATFTIGGGPRRRPQNL